MEMHGFARSTSKRSSPFKKLAFTLAFTCSFIVTCGFCSTRMPALAGVVTLTEVKEKIGRAETEGLSKQAGRCPTGGTDPNAVASGAKKSPPGEGGGGATKVAGNTGARPGRGGDCPDYMFNGQSCTDGRGRTCTVAGGRRMCSNPAANLRSDPGSE